MSKTKTHRQTSSAVTRKRKNTGTPERYSTYIYECIYQAACTNYKKSQQNIEEADILSGHINIKLTCVCVFAALCVLSYNSFIQKRQPLAQSL